MSFFWGSFLEPDSALRVSRVRSYVWVPCLIRSSGPLTVSNDTMIGVINDSARGPGFGV